ncbi:hypothetical protein CK203_097815 [Vitis vinifera]|uniref:Uncharacterized protein n=1 Tax=Vitis vinifera TaxID=29760 RepID=A0A438DFR9_VITVI|nr:hypothetical protein CK203_097815 [Vitis vinifera]
MPLLMATEKLLYSSPNFRDLALSNIDFSCLIQNEWSEKLRRRELRMCYEKDDKQWSCGKAGLSSIMRDIGEPCLHHSPIKVVITIRPCKTVIFWYKEKGS